MLTELAVLKVLVAVAAGAVALGAGNAGAVGALIVRHRAPVSSAQIHSAHRVVRASPSGGGNLVVSVPRAPSQSALPGLCEALLHRDTVGTRGTNTVATLTAATGGTVQAATAWCDNYVRSEGHTAH